MNNKIQIIIALLLSQSLMAFSQNQPNIILFITDDQGWNGTSLEMILNDVNSKSDYYITPNLERLAQGGMTFAQGYAPAAKCSPTRNSVLTGQTPASSKFTTTGNGVSSGKILTTPVITPKINAASTVLPELIQQIDSDYMTAHFGKWHLGNVGPDGHGFDRSDGATGNHTGNATDGLTIQTDPKKIFTLTDSSINFMDDAVAANRPFYLQVSHYAVHTALEATQSTFNIYNDPTQRPLGTNHNDPLYGSMTEDLDKSLGMLLDKLDSLGIMNNTYIIYMSDNGAQNGQSTNVPLRRSKIFLAEGGIRVPFVIAGPNISTNSRSTVPVVGYDLYPTIIEWIDGNTNAVPSNVEGGSLVATLNNGTTSVNRPIPMVFHSPHYDTAPSKRPSSAIIEDNYKLFVDYQSGSFELYDLDTDIGETTNLFTTLPTIGTDLCLKLRDYLKSVSADMPTLDPTHANNIGTAPDVDNDGLDDDWEFRELLTVKYDGTDDPDGDGDTNAEEFANGTDPYQNTINTTNQLKEYEIKVYPNPVKDVLVVELPQYLESQSIQLLVTDIYGQRLDIFSFNNNSQMKINTANFPKGLLFLEIRNEDGVLLSTEKIYKR